MKGSEQFSVSVYKLNKGILSLKNKYGNDTCKGKYILH